MGFRLTSFQIGGHSLPPSSGGNSVDWLGHLPVCRQDSIPRPMGRLSVPTRFLVACCVVWRLRVLLPGATNFPGLNTPTIHYRRPPQVYPHSMLASVTSLRYSLPSRPSPPCLQCRRSFRGVGAPGGGWGQLCVVPECVLDGPLIDTGLRLPDTFAVRRCGFPLRIYHFRLVPANWCPVSSGLFLLSRFSAR